MATILKGYQFRLYPNNEQKKLINQTIGCSRFIYNHFLEERINEYEKTGISKTCYEQIKEIPELCKNYPWLKEVDSCSLRNPVFYLENAYHNFFSQTGGFPKFKNKDTGNSYKTNNIKSTYKDKSYESIRIDLKNRTITLPKLKDLSIRKRECPKCGCIHDRDINASINIMFEGLKIFMQSLV